jgi:solute carrier family 10 (sodium/bile acid cotransporter), member 7
LSQLLASLRAGAGRLGLDGFVIALGASIALAALLPGPGVQTGPFSLRELANYGVSAIFFFYGLRLDPEKLRRGLSNWKLHLVVQSATFLLFPLLMIGFRQLFGPGGDELLWLGAFYVAALPSTVSSSVVMVSIAGGNIAAAIFNASISSLIGVFLTPLWMGLFIAASAGGFDLGPVVLKLIVQVLVPVAAGILLHRWGGGFAERHKANLRRFDQTVILLIVYTSFCESFAQRLFANHSAAGLLWLGAAMIALFFLVYFLITALSRLLGFDRGDRIAAVFCGSKKSLVHGTVMSKVLFAGNPAVGIILLPLMIYHALQLVAASILAQSMARRGSASGG